MEFAEEGSLYDFLEKKKRNEKNINWNIKYKISINICKGLNEIHKNNIIHNDIKSPNILLDKNYSGKVRDFDISKNNNNEINEEISGSLQWRSPESFNNDFSFFSDIYSLGIVLWELLTIEIPFKDLNQEEIIEYVLIKDLRPDINIKSPSLFIQMIKKCWNKNILIRSNF